MSTYASSRLDRHIDSHPLSRRAIAAVTIAALASVIPFLALLGYIVGVPALLSTNPEYAAISPVTAVSLLLLVAGLILIARTPRRPHWLLPATAGGLAIIPLVLVIVQGEDSFSPAIARQLHLTTVNSARMSLGTSLSLIVIAVALLPGIRNRRQLPDALAVIALLIAGIALLGYSYGSLDLHALTLFRTMAVRSAVAISLLAIATITLRAENGLFALVSANNEAGGATRRQLLMTLAGPAIGWGVLHLFRDAHLSVGASLAVFVGITMGPLIWLILRDGRLLDDLSTLRRTQREAGDAHTRDLEQQLDRQATQLKRQTADQISDARDAKVHSDNRYKTLFQSIDAGFCIIAVKFEDDGKSIDYQFLETNKTFEALTGLKDAPGKWMRTLVPTNEQHWFDIYGEIAKTQTPRRFQNPAKALDDRWYDVHAFPVDEPHLHRVGILFNDITAQRRSAEALQQINSTLEERVSAAIAEREEAQEALRQAQKMEAVGQLTGGLAHDFNNLLQGIGGSLQLLRSRLTQGRTEDAFRFIDASEGAVRRAAALTHRLLAFSRRQTLEPKPTDLNTLMTGMQDLIRRTVGPHIILETVAAEGLWNTLVDQSQLENALLNLSINARDAMPEGGRLVVETINKELDARSAAEREMLPGQYVKLSVSDEGCGMSPEVVARAFDPFFTTKPLGSGTGLGLSMIYGFAKQSGGQVRIHSQVGQGTVVTLWLPRYGGDAVESDAQTSTFKTLRGQHEEVVLIVDDEPTIRMLIKDVLDEAGFASLEAANGADALEILATKKRIDLLITDVGLPGGLNGRQVADAARVSRPEMTILFITGFAENAVLSHGHLPAGMNILTKPFEMDVLDKRIRNLLGH